MGVLSLLLALSLSGSVWAATVQSTGQTVVLGGVAYYLPSAPITYIHGSASLKAKATQDGLIAINVLQAANGTDVQAISSRFSASDDVWSSAFMDSVYMQTSGSSSGVSTVANATVYTASVSKNDMIPEGPYFMSSSGAVYEAWRLYTDFAGAFTETTIGDGNGSYSVLPANVPGQQLAVAVPSRLYFTKTAEKPLAGVRTGIKDVYDVAGLRTSDGNRA